MNKEKVVIDGFQKEFRFLSNFWPCKVTLDGTEYNSTEHAYQSAKTFDVSERNKMKKMTAGEVKKYARTLPLREDWESIKFDIMLDLNRQKFKKGSELAEMLLTTEDAELIEGNFWHDLVWGQCHCKIHNDVNGRNELGKILMKIRNELKE